MATCTLDMAVAPRIVDCLWPGAGLGNSKGTLSLWAEGPGAKGYQVVVGVVDSCLISVNGRVGNIFD